MTPGPWKLNGRYGELKDEVAGSGRAVATVWTRKTINTVKDSQRGTETVADPEGEANLRTILALPELLYACELTFAHLTSAAHAKTKIIPPVFEALRSAIEKARGTIK